MALHKLQHIVTIFIVLFCAMLFYSSNSSKVVNYTIKKVVIDAGHGGHDPGAVGKRSKEKDIVLSIALKLGALIEKNLPGVKVIYTRTTDEFVELHRRAQIANENQADLFISLHCNASKSPDPYGAETFVMGLHKTDGNMAVARAENASILLETDYKTAYEGFDINKGFDPNSTEFYISYQLYQKAYLDQSIVFASYVQQQLVGGLKRFDRGVKQAGFLVLWKTTMPGVLIEVGFLSNPKEEDYLRTDKAQYDLAMSIFKAFRSYKSKIEGVSTPYAEVIHTQTVFKDTIDELQVNVVSVKDSVLNSVHEKKTVEPNAVASNLPAVVFKIQVATVRDLAILKQAPYNQLEKLSYYEQDGLYKITVGEEYDYNKAAALQTKLRNQGIKDAFLVCFHNGKRIPVQEGLNILKK